MADPEYRAMVGAFLLIHELKFFKGSAMKNSKRRTLVSDNIEL